MKRFFKNNKAITLIALVITIIILLILAGVAIASLTNSGLFNKTKDAVERYREAQNDENQILQNYMDEILKYSNSNGGSNNRIQIDENDDSIAMVNEYYILKKNGKLYSYTPYDSNGTSEELDESKLSLQLVAENVIDIIGGFYYLSDGKLYDNKEIISDNVKTIVNTHQYYDIEYLTLDGKLYLYKIYDGDSYLMDVNVDNAICFGNQGLLYKKDKNLFLIDVKYDIDFNNIIPINVSSKKILFSPIGQIIAYDDNHDFFLSNHSGRFLGGVSFVSR